MTLSEERPHQSNQFTSCGSAIKSKQHERDEIEDLTQEWLKRNSLKNVPFDPVSHTYHGAPENALGIDSGAHRRKLGLTTPKGSRIAVKSVSMDLDDGFDIEGLI